MEPVGDIIGNNPSLRREAEVRLAENGPWSDRLARGLVAYEDFCKAVGRIDPYVVILEKDAFLGVLDNLCALGSWCFVNHIYETSDPCPRGHEDIDTDTTVDVSHAKGKTKSDLQRLIEMSDVADRTSIRSESTRCAVGIFRDEIIRDVRDYVKRWSAAHATAFDSQAKSKPHASSMSSGAFGYISGIIQSMGKRLGDAVEHAVQSTLVPSIEELCARARCWFEGRDYAHRLAYYLRTDMRINIDQYTFGMSPGAVLAFADLPVIQPKPVLRQQVNLEDPAWRPPGYYIEYDREADVYIMDDETYSFASECAWFMSGAISWTSVLYVRLVQDVTGIVTRSRVSSVASTPSPGHEDVVAFGTTDATGRFVWSDESSGIATSDLEAPVNQPTAHSDTTDDPHILDDAAILSSAMEHMPQGYGYGLLHDGELTSILNGRDRNRNLVAVGDVSRRDDLIRRLPVAGAISRLVLPDGKLRMDVSHLVAIMSETQLFNAFYDLGESPTPPSLSTGSAVDRSIYSYHAYLASTGHMNGPRESYSEIRNIYEAVASHTMHYIATRNVGSDQSAAEKQNPLHIRYTTVEFEKIGSNADKAEPGRLTKAVKANVINATNAELGLHRWQRSFAIALAIVIELLFAGTHDVNIGDMHVGKLARAILIPLPALHMLDSRSQIPQHRQPQSATSVSQEVSVVAISRMAALALSGGDEVMRRALSNVRFVATDG